MGNLIVWAKPPTEATWDYAKIERSTSSTGTFTEIASQNVDDNTYYDTSGGENNYYRIRFYDDDSGTYSAYSNVATGSTYTTYYADPRDVARYLQVDEFGGEGQTQPTIQDVTEMIKDAEDEFDKKTSHAWRELTVTEEMHDLNQLDYQEGAGWPIYLAHRKIKTLDSDEGDKIEIWDGDNWTDWITSSSYTEGRDEDYWLDYQNGILYIRSLSDISYDKSSIRITYRYGNSTVPNDIRKAIAKMVAIEILDSSDRTLIVPEGMQSRPSWESKISRWKEDIQAIISNYTEVAIKAFGS